MKAKYLALLGLTAAVTFAPAALASQINFSFNGGGISSSGIMTVSQPSTSGAAQITDISGMFSDTNVGVSGGIAGLYTPVSYHNDPRTGPIASTTGGLSYDDLFYPAGDSPVLCYDENGDVTYPFSGGLFDIYGVAFNIVGPGGYVAELWSNGNIPGQGTVYAAGLADANGLVDNPNPHNDEIPPGVYGSFTTTTAPVPEPGSLSLFGLALFGLLVALYARRRKGAPLAQSV